MLGTSTETSTPTRRRARVRCLTCGLLAGPLALAAHAEGTASTFVAAGNLAKDGTLKVKETITFTGTAPATVSQKFETRQDVVGDKQYVTELSARSAPPPRARP